MKIIDISWPITENVTEYKDRTSVKLTSLKSFTKDKGRETLITIHSHTGTHVDAQSHFLRNGMSIDAIDLNKLIGTCQVLDMTQIEKKITKRDLQRFTIKKHEIILLKTKNSYLSPTEKFNPDFIYLDHSGAEFLVEKQIKSVGIDYLGIEREQVDHGTHTLLLENNIPIIEGLRLKNISKTHYMFYCLPILFKHIDSSPARAVLIET
jgi:arylformamidase